MRYKSILWLFIFSFNIHAIYSQSESMKKMISIFESKFSEFGYSEIDSGGIIINNKIGIEPDTKIFYRGVYFVVVIIDNCSSCSVVILKEDYSKNTYEKITPSMQRDIANTSFITYKFIVTDVLRGRINVSMNQDSSHYAYLMLFSDPY